MTHDNNIEYMHPDIIELCVNCTSITCSRGECQRVRDKIREIIGQSKRGPREYVYEYNGQRHTLREWAEIVGVNYETIASRKKRGEPIADWFRPVGKHIRKKGAASHAQ